MGTQVLESAWGVCTRVLMASRWHCIRLLAIAAPCVLLGSMVDSPKATPLRLRKAMAAAPMIQKRTWGQRLLILCVTIAILAGPSLLIAIRGKRSAPVWHLPFAAAA